MLSHPAPARFIEPSFCVKSTLQSDESQVVIDIKLLMHAWRSTTAASNHCIIQALLVVLVSACIVLCYPLTEASQRQRAPCPVAHVKKKAERNALKQAKSQEQVHWGSVQSSVAQ